MVVLLTAVGIPIGVVLGALAVGLLSRRAHRSRPGVFPCKVRKASARSQPWGRRTAYARWVHDVLLVHSGMPLIRYEALAVRSVDTPATRVDDVRFIGSRDPVSVRVILDDGSTLDLASPSRWEGLLAGPFGSADVGAARPPLHPTRPTEPRPTPGGASPARSGT